MSELIGIPEVARQVLNDRAHPCPVLNPGEWVVDLLKFAAERYGFANMEAVDFLRLYHNDLEEGTVFGVVDEDFVIAYRADVRARKGGIVAKQVGVFVSWFFQGLMRRDKLRLNPAAWFAFYARRSFKPSHTSRPRHVLTLEEAATVLEVLAAWGQAEGLPWELLFLFLCETGARIGETLKIQVAHCEPGKVWLPGEDRKNRSPLLKYLSPDLAEMLQSHIDSLPSDQQRLWVGPGGVVHYNKWRVVLAEATARAGVSKRITPHTLRHFSATELRRQGKPYRVIQQHLGHRDEASTLPYIHEPTTAQEEIMESRTVQVTRAATQVLLGRIHQ